jgi:hypothetical protein
MDWIHIQQNKDSELAKLYQVGGYPTSFLINPKGVIIALSEDLRSENLMQTIEKYIK